MEKVKGRGEKGSRRKKRERIIWRIKRRFNSRVEEEGGDREGRRGWWKRRKSRWAKVTGGQQLGKSNIFFIHR